MVCGENCFALGEQPEDVGCELYVAMARGEGEDGEAGASWGLEVTWLDLRCPYYACSVVLLVVNTLLIG